MIDAYFWLRKKIANSIFAIFFALYLLSTAYHCVNETCFSWFYWFSIIVFLTFYFLYYFKKIGHLSFVFLLFLFYNPLFDHLFQLFPWFIKISLYGLSIIFFKKLFSKNAKIILFANALFLLGTVASSVYSESFNIIEKNSSIQTFIIDKLKQQQSVDIILLDAYPDFKLIEDSLHSKSQLKEYLVDHEFNIMNNKSYSIKTPISLAQLFFNKCIIPSEIGLEFKDRTTYYQNIIQNSNLTKYCDSHNIPFQFLSPTNINFDKNAWALYWNQSNTRHFGLLFKIMNNCQKVIFYVQNFIKKNTHFSIEQIYTYHQIDEYNNKVLFEFNQNQTRHGLHLNVFHFLTLHKYNVNNPQKAFQQDLERADILGIRLLNQLLKNNKSHIVLLSDHGNRTLIKNTENQKRGILAIKELK